MNKIARSVNEGIELVNAMLKDRDAYLDWGFDDCYTNISCKYFADEVARHFQNKGYFVYYQLMGWGSNRVAEGTPIAIRIKKEPKCSGSSLVPFN